MRLSLILFILVIAQVKAESAYSQDAKLSIKLSNTTVESVLSKIEQSSEFHFIYNSSIVDVDRVVSIDVNNKSITSVLDAVFAGTDVVYELDNKHIVLKKAEVTQKAPQQDKGKKIAGAIRDENSEPIIGATVKVKNTEEGTLTDLEGLFEISAPNNAILEVTYVGYISQEVGVRGRSEISIVLKEDLKLLDEVVIVGYGSQKKGNLTGAVSSINSDVLEDRPISSVGAGLQGVIPNLNITMDNGLLGGGAKFNIRGTTNLSGASPLILVDGIEMDPNLINPTDIESVVVLKDAASAAIYGSRAAFGVILITTKSGVEQSPKITFNATYSFNKPTVTPEPPNSLDYANWMNAANRNTSGNDYFDTETMEHIKAYYYDPQNNLPVFVHSASTPNKYTYVGNTNWYKELNRSTYPLQKYDVGIQGGNKDVKYFTSASLFKQDGISKWSDEEYKRYSLLQNVTYKVTNWMEVGVRASLSVSDLMLGGTNKHGQNASNQTIAGDTRPLTPVFHPDGNFSNGGMTNPAAWQSLGGGDASKSNDVRGTGTLKLTPLKGLVINADYTYSYFNRTSKRHRREFWEYDALGAGTLFPHTTPSAAVHGRNEIFYNILNAYAEYSKSFNQQHNFKLMTGFNQESSKRLGVDSYRNNLIANNIPSTSLATGERGTTDSEEKWATRGAFVRFNYDFDSKYLLEFNGRYDGSSRFPKQDRFKFFPSASVGWRTSAENFWEPLRSVANDFKLRGSYGSLGNQVASSAYPYIPSYGNSEIGYLFGDNKEMGITPPGLVSHALTWETVDQWDIGFDLHMLDSKFVTTFDYYSRTTKDMLTKSKTLPAILGVAEPNMNAADLRTNGWELSLEWRQKLNNGFNYNATFILADYTSKITKFDNPTKNFDGNQNYVGKKWGEIWGFVTEGLFASDEEAAAWDQSKVAKYTQGAGDIKFADLDGKPGITKGSNTVDDPGDRKIIGNSTPRYSYGMRLGADWKGFDCTVFFQGVGKREVAASNVMYLAQYTSQWSVPQQMSMDYWSEDNRDAFYPKPRFNGDGVVTEAQTRYLLDASYVRWKQLAIGYTIPKNITERAGMSKLRVYFNIDNLWEHSNMPKTFDPEIAVVNAYPFMRSFAFGLNLAF